MNTTFPVFGIKMDEIPETVPVAKISKYGSAARLPNLRGD
jgi:hypothetical protein